MNSSWYILYTYCTLKLQCLNRYQQIRRLLFFQCGAAADECDSEWISVNHRTADTTGFRSLPLVGCCCRLSTSTRFSLAFYPLLLLLLLLLLRSGRSGCSRNHFHFSYCCVGSCGKITLATVFTFFNGGVPVHKNRQKQQSTFHTLLDNFFPRCSFFFFSFFFPSLITKNHRTNPQFSFTIFLPSTIVQN